MRKAVSLIGALLALTLSSWASAEYSVGFGAPISSLVRVSFPDSSTRFQPPSDVVDVLADAKDAAMIYVSGRTSTGKPSARDEALAFARAAAARAYLIERGVSPLKIMVNYVSAADYIEDNSTVAGRLANQRVDIELIFVPRY
jgi:outer membrane protein OmpA-like peptidoglycan-associated protein